MRAKPIKPRVPRQIKLDGITEYLRLNPDSTVREIGNAINAPRGSMGNYLAELQILGLAHISEKGGIGHGGRRFNQWSLGKGVNTPDPISIHDDDAVSYEPKFAHVAAWAHGSATRYSMGRAV